MVGDGSSRCGGSAPSDVLCTVHLWAPTPATRTSYGRTYVPHVLSSNVRACACRRRLARRGCWRWLWGRGRAARQPPPASWWWPPWPWRSPCTRSRRGCWCCSRRHRPVRVRKSVAVRLPRRCKDVSVRRGALFACHAHVAAASRDVGLEGRLEADEGRAGRHARVCRLALRFRVQLKRCCARRVNSLRVWWTGARRCDKAFPHCKPPAHKTGRWACSPRSK
jgi:hypothetical protein